MLDRGRRAFISLLGGAVAMWPIRARAQQAGMPVVGWLSTRAPGEGAYLLAAFRQGLKEAGYRRARRLAQFATAGPALSVVERAPKPASPRQVPHC
jgi:putative ABC transport system substrate-binding protein